MCVSVNRVDTVDCAKLLEGSLLWTLGYFPSILLTVIVIWTSISFIKKYWIIRLLLAYYGLWEYNNNNEYLERLTRTGLSAYTFFTNTYCQNSTHTTWRHTHKDIRRDLMRHCSAQWRGRIIGVCLSRCVRACVRARACVRVRVCAFMLYALNFDNMYL